MDRNKKNLVALIIIFLIAFVVRFYNLGLIPDGLQQDETSIGYNAYSILKTGRDEHGVFMPINFKAFGEYKLPGYIYASVPPIAVFGLTPFGIRFIAALSGFLSVIVVFFLTQEILKLYKQSDSVSIAKISLDSIPYLVTFLFAINPWQVHFSRAAFEVTLANFFILLAVWLFLKSVLSKRIVFFYVSMIFFIASVYTYNIARLFAPLLFLLLISMFWKAIVRYSPRFYIGVLIVGIVSLLPFLLSTIHEGGINSTLGTLIFSSAKVQAPLQEFRSYFIMWPILVQKVLFNTWSLTFWQYLNNVFAHFSTSFYFLRGSGNGIDGTGTTGQWYLFELPLVLVGIIWLWRMRGYPTRIIFGWIASLILVSSLTREPPQATRTFFLVFPITFCSGIGLWYVVQNIRLVKERSFRYIVWVASFGIGIYFVVLYFSSYYTRFPVYFAKNWRTADREVAQYLKDNDSKYTRIVIDRDSGLLYSSLLTYLLYPPENFQKEVQWEKGDSEGFSFPMKFGKYEFREIDWGKDLGEKNVLLIGSADKVPTDISSQKVIYFPTRPIVISLGQEIVRYPVTEPAYVIVDSGKDGKVDGIIVSAE